MLHVFSAEVDAGAVADAKASGHTNSLGRRRPAETRKPKGAAKRASTCRPIVINLVANCERITWARGRNSSKSLTNERKKMAVTRCGWFLCACPQSNADTDNYAAMAPTGSQAPDCHESAQCGQTARAFDSSVAGRARYTRPADAAN